MEEIKEEISEIQEIDNSSTEQPSEQPKKVVKNIIVVAFGNICTILAGVLVGFLVPKMMINGDTNIDYGYYKIFQLYYGYIGLFHFGFCDGFLLLYAGKKYDELNKERFRTLVKFFLAFQIIVSLIVLVVALPFVKTEYGFIFAFLSVNLLAGNITEFYQQICQATGRFKELSLRNIIKAILNSVIVIALYALYKTNVIDFLKYQIYIYCFTAVNWFLAIWYIIRYREITFGRSVKLKECLSEIKKFYVVGIPILISRLVSVFILNIDRQFVSILFSTETYASYAFAYNMLQLITIATGAVSIVLFPTLKKFSEDKLKSHYNSFISIVVIFSGLCLLAYFPLHVIVTTFLDKYVDSLPIFQVILPGVIMSSAISMIMLNYYKSLNKSFTYFIISIIILVLSTLANLIAYFIYKTPLSISIASLIVMSIWYLVTEFILTKNWKIKTIKNICYIVLVVTAFFLITIFVDNIYLSGVCYLGAYLVLTLVFYFKLIKNKFRIK